MWNNSRDLRNWERRADSQPGTLTTMEMGEAARSRTRLQETNCAALSGTGDPDRAAPEVQQAQPALTEIQVIFDRLFEDIEPAPMTPLMGVAGAERRWVAATVVAMFR